MLTIGLPLFAAWEHTKPRTGIYGSDCVGLVAPKPGDGLGVQENMTHCAAFYLGAVACLQRALGGHDAPFFMLGNLGHRRSDISCRVPVEAAEQATRALFSDLPESRIEAVLESVRTLVQVLRPARKHRKQEI